MSEFEKYSLITQTLAAIGTIVVAVVAIWGDFLRSKLASPHLQLNLRNYNGETTTFSNGTKVLYYHLVVSNSRNWAPAKNVIVYLTHVERPGPDGNWQPAMYTGPVALVWQFGNIYSGYPAIGTDRICDLGRIAEDNQFELTTQFLPNGLDCFVKAGQKIRIHLVASGDNAKSNDLIVEIAWDGEWVYGTQEMKKHLIIKELVRENS